MKDLHQQGAYESVRNPLRLLLADLREKSPAGMLVVYGFFGKPDDGRVLCEFAGSTESRFLDGVSTLGLSLLCEGTVRAGAAEFERTHGQKVAVVIEWMIPNVVPLSALVEMMAEQIVTHVSDVTVAPDDIRDGDFVQIVLAYSLGKEKR